MKTIKLNKANFEEVVLNADKPVLVDFWASWCGPCRMLGPIIDQIANEEDIVVGKVNVDEEMELATQFQIMSIPTMIVFKNGKIVNKIVGVRSKEQIMNEVLR